MGIAHESSTKFRDVRAKATDEIRNLHKSKKKKKGTEFILYDIGTLVVASSHRRSNNKNYALIEVVDFDVSERKYFGIVVKASFDYDRIGRIVSFEEGQGWCFGWQIEKIKEEDVRWFGEEKIIKESS